MIRGKHIFLPVAFGLISGFAQSYAAAQENPLHKAADAPLMTLDGKLELKVTKIERVAQWKDFQQGTMEKMTVAASAGHEFVRVHFNARWLDNASGDPCEPASGYVLPPLYTLHSVGGGSVRGLVAEYGIPVNALRSGCTGFTLIFQESPAGASLLTVRFKDVEVDISRAPGAKGDSVR
jgi:hypothetical protein